MLTRTQFAFRVAQHFALGVAAIGCALGIGVLGYRLIAGLSWIDSLLNASMILGGMGPVNELHSDAAKVFASMYALFSGLVFIAIMGLLLAPFMHRLMHRLHIDDKEK